MDRISHFARLKAWIGNKRGLVFAVSLVLLNGSFVYWKSHSSHEKAAPARTAEAEEAGAFETPVDGRAKEAGETHASAAAPRSFAKAPLSERIWLAYRGFFHGLQEKVDRIRSLESDNRRLELENANLRRWGEGLRFGCETKTAEIKTHRTGMMLSFETGAEMGRTLASIRYTPPANLLPKQLYALAVSYFKAKEDEKAAVILTFLTGLEDDNTYKTPKNYLMTGVAWYRLDHWVESDAYFDRVIKAQAAADTLPYQAQARLWKAIVAQRKNNRVLAQLLLRDLMEKHPRSPEVEWINTQGADRSIANDPMELIENDHRVEGAVEQ